MVKNFTARILGRLFKDAVEGHGGIIKKKRTEAATRTGKVSFP